MPTYRLEEASTSRAGCQNKECKDEKIKIMKGELRLGTWVDNERFQSFFWRHWGCVTPKIIANLKETLTGSSGEIDYTLLDGYEELSPENQAKVRKALEQGHVADSEWKGDPEFNRPGMTGFRKREPKKKTGAEAKDGESDIEQESPKPKKRGRGAADGKADGKPKNDTVAPAAKKAKKEDHGKPAADEDDGKAAETSPKPTKPVSKRGRPPKTAAVVDEKAEKKTEKEAEQKQKERKRKSADASAGTDEVNDTSQKSSKKGRKALSAQETETGEEKPKRGRKKATASEEPKTTEDAAPVEKPKRGRKKAASESKSD
ncbi:poly polymerase and DNA-ligase Zn-finger region-domain-containing protein [Thermoascus aurantiacus ATCC 26904]